MSGIANPYRYQYETVAASQTGQVLGGTGAKGDYLHRLITSTSVALTSTVTWIDGATSIVIHPAGGAGGLGAESLEMNMASVSGAWSITTGAGCKVIAVGIFSA
jgi:hypothetical protein